MDYIREFLHSYTISGLKEMIGEFNGLSSGRGLLSIFCLLFVVAPIPMVFQFLLHRHWVKRLSLDPTYRNSILLYVERQYKTDPLPMVRRDMKIFGFLSVLFVLLHILLQLIRAATAP